MIRCLYLISLTHTPPPLRVNSCEQEIQIRRVAKLNRKVCIQQLQLSLIGRFASPFGQERAWRGVTFQLSTVQIARLTHPGASISPRISSRQCRFESLHAFKALHSPCASTSSPFAGRIECASERHCFNFVCKISVIMLQNVWDAADIGCRWLLRFLRRNYVLISLKLYKERSPNPLTI
jgi:hypothetical protein